MENGSFHTIAYGTVRISVENDGILRKEEDIPQPIVAPIARRLLYLSHTLNQLSEITWQFCLAVFLAAVTNYQSLLFVSTYGLTVRLAVCLFASRMGRRLDQAKNRLALMRRLLVMENTSVLAATLSCFVLLTRTGAKLSESAKGIQLLTESGNNESRYDILSILTLVMVHVLGGMAQVFDNAFLVSMERDWVVVIAQGDHQILSNLNVAMKQIDLTCKLVAPALAGLVMPLLGGGQPQPQDLTMACIATGTLTIASLIFEYGCTTRIFSMIPALQERTTHVAHQDSEQDHMEQTADSTKCDWLEQLGCQIKAMKAYFQQPSALGGLGLALLYANALTFDNGIVSGYLLYRGMHLSTVGILRGFASLVGLCGTYVYKLSVKQWSLPITGLWSICYEFVCICLAFSSVYARNTTMEISLLVGGITLSRIGLWIYDISITQMQQRDTPDHVRGLVGGTQESLNAGFNFLAFLVIIIVPDPSFVFVYVGAAALCVGSAMCLYVYGLYLPLRRYSHYESKTLDTSLSEHIPTDEVD